MSICHTHALSVAFLSAFVLAPFACARGEEDAEAAQAAASVEAKTELNYITALVEAGWPDLAEPVIAAAKTRWPEMGPKLKVLELQSSLNLGRFDEVKKVLAAKKTKDAEYWALNLSMADAYYSRRELDTCRKIYQDFFKAVPKPGPDLMDFYVESGFKWAQMCIMERNFDEAVKMYGELLTKNLPEERWCAVAMEDAGLLIQMAEDIVVDDPKKDKAKLDKRNGYLASATKLVDKLLWKNELIIVFGKAIAMKAHIEMLRGDAEKAQNLVSDYMPQLAEIHNSLKEQDPDGSKGFVRMSPMPECRYLLAKMLWDSAKAEAKAAKPDDVKILAAILGAKGSNGKRNGLGAFNHAVNVYITYPESSSAADAGQIYEEIAAFVLERYKKDLKAAVKVPEGQIVKVRRMQFDNAYKAYKDNDFKGAVKAYKTLLAQFPDAEEAPGAFGVMADSCLSLWGVEKDKAAKDALRADATAAENELLTKFAGKGGKLERDAGDELLRLAVKERELGQLARSQEIYTSYFKSFATHYNAAATALKLASQAYKAEDWATAIRYYEVVATAYTDSPHYADALNYLTLCSEKTGDVEAQKSWMRKFVEASKKISEKTGAQLRLAQMEQRDGFAAFAAAAETNVVEAAVELRKTAARDVAGAIVDFRKVSTALSEELKSNTGLAEEEKNKFLVRCEQAMILEADSWQRLAWPEEKIPAFRKNAIGAYERYLAAYPQGKWGPVSLVKIATINMAEKDMEASQKAFARLQKDFPESDEAKNSVPRLAKTLIEMGLRQEGVEQYKQMLETKGGKYSAGQFLQAGDALLEARGWGVATEAYARAIELAPTVTNESARAVLISRAEIGQAKADYGRKDYSGAHMKLDSFIAKYPKSALVVDAYEMLVEVASEEGRTSEKEEDRTRNFNAAVGAVKKLRQYRKTQTEKDVIDLRSAEILLRKIEAEEAMHLAEKAEETCRRAIVGLQTFLMSRAPTPDYPASKMSAQQLENLERCYGDLLPLMAKLGRGKLGEDQFAKIAEYGAAYMDLFPDGKHKTQVQNALNQAKAEK